MYTRRFLLQTLTVAMGFTSMLMVYTTLGLLTNCNNSFLVVVSGSMEPGIYRGDIIFLTNIFPQEYRTGDIVVYQLPGKQIPIVHRVVEARENDVGDVSQHLLTKGDNNDIDDVGLYEGLQHLEKKHVIGTLRCILPMVGYVSILFNEFPRIRYAVFGAIGLLNLLPF
ncbi:signal peptidase I [Mycena rebaudengoi]|nr:signal peptidase I [Mycena rebaudengoi]